MNDHPTLRQSQPGEVAFLGLVALGAVIGSVNLVAGAIDGVISGTGPAWPTTKRIPHVLFCLYRYPTIPALDYKGSSRYVPGPSVLFYWILVGVVLAAVISLMIGVLRFHHRLQRGKARLPGVRKEAWASKEIVREQLSEKAAAKRDRVPVEARTTFYLGRSAGLPAYKATEDSIALYGPSRSGKTTAIVIPAILDASGPVVTTMTRPETAEVTYTSRHALPGSTIWRFDPQGMTSLGSELRWSLSSGCLDPLIARTRASALAKGTSAGVAGGDFWELRTVQVWEALLHAAALCEAGIQYLRQWASSPENARDALTVLKSAPGASPGWAGSLAAIIASDPRHRDSVWSGVAAAAAPLALPPVAAICDNSGGVAFDIDEFLGAANTLYVLGTAEGGLSARPIVNALISAIAERARMKAAHTRGGRLRLNLSLILDEFAKLCPLPFLPSLLADGGGMGMSIIVVIQALSQLATAYSEAERSEIWGNASTKIALGGGGDPAELEDISRLIGEWTTTEQSTSTGGAGGGHITQLHTRHQRIAPPDWLREQPAGQGVLLYRNVAPALVHLRPWYERPDARRLTAAFDAICNQEGI